MATHFLSRSHRNSLRPIRFKKKVKGFHLDDNSEISEFRRVFNKITRKYKQQNQLHSCLAVDYESTQMSKNKENGHNIATSDAKKSEIHNMHLNNFTSNDCTSAMGSETEISRDSSQNLVLCAGASSIQQVKSENKRLISRSNTIRDILDEITAIHNNLKSIYEDFDVRLKRIEQKHRYADLHLKQLVQSNDQMEERTKRIRFDLIDVLKHILSDWKETDRPIMYEPVTDGLCIGGIRTLDSSSTNSKMASEIKYFNSRTNSSLRKDMFLLVILLSIIVRFFFIKK